MMGGRDPLRERLLAPELFRARESTVSAKDLVAKAAASVNSALAAGVERDGLIAELALLQGAPRLARVEAWLRATSADPKAFAALRRGDPDILDSPTITERVARTTDALERQAEAYLIAAREAESAPLTPDDAPSLLSLAQRDGRWSRRVEALALISRCFRGSNGESPRSHGLQDGLRELVAPHEHRWVQVAAYGALRSVDAPRALEAALRRLRERASGDDFLVRTGIVRVFAATREGCPPELLDLAREDPSDTVRSARVAAERRVDELARTSHHDPSPKVRAAALLRLTRRAGFNAVTTIATSARADAADLVVRAAATSLVRLATRQGFTPFEESTSALVEAAGRVELPAAVRAECQAAWLQIETLHRDAAELEALQSLVEQLPPGSSVLVRDPQLGRAAADTLARTLAVVANHDFPLGLTRERRGLRLYRGETTGVALWRLIHEITHPGPSKRQTLSHATTRRARGELRAPPGLLAEATATTVPGERVLVPRTGGWGRYLPRVGDIVDACSLRGRPVAIADARGIVTIHAPSGALQRLRARARLTVGYAGWAELRQRSLVSSEPDAQRAFVRALARKLGVALSFTPHALEARPELGAPPIYSELDAEADTAPRPIPTIALALPAMPGFFGAARGQAIDVWDEFVEYATWRAGGHLAELALFAGLVLALWVLRATFIRQAIDADRKATALVIGGWGTRGKSGTERLKAAFFQGLGFENLVKTTGCEAMFIHSMPGVPASEVFIYRPYDKATVWEQRDVLRLARRFDVRTLLWECMALQPDLVNLLQCQWMRDDMSTITNAYPDHEDVQGPTGYDVASTIAEFVPESARLFTTERQMLPILAHAAKERQTSVVAVRDLEVDLIPDDLLVRFGHQEHPSNIALVARIARHFAVPAFVAIAEMADNVLADLGALKTFPAVPWLGRTLAFTNGMGANDRAGTLGNFERSGLAAIDPDAAPERWVVTVVNNRADRVSRSEVFARILVEDVRARRHILIGTNVSGLLGFIDTALTAFLVSRSPIRDLPTDQVDRLETAHARIDTALRNLAIGATTVASFEAESAAFAWPRLADGLADTALRPGSSSETYADALRAIDGAVPTDVSSEVRPFLVEALARRRTTRALHASIDEHLASAPEKVETTFSAAYRAMFQATLVPLHDPTLSGDAILDAVARSVAPAARASVIGVQNIKGTGLDFVYRWVSIGRVSRLLEGLGSPTLGERGAALRALTAHDDYGLIDATIALAAVRRARAIDTELGSGAFDPVEAMLARTVAARTVKRTTPSRRQIFASLGTSALKAFDFVDAVRRRSAASLVIDDLTSGLISHAAAARRMRAIVERGKGK
jgi:poly-gamma-glutamate synthase PgsB/CapB